MSEKQKTSVLFFCFFFKKYNDKMVLDINTERNNEKTDVTNTSNEINGELELVIKTFSRFSIKGVQC